MLIDESLQFKVRNVGTDCKLRSSYMLFMRIEVNMKIQNGESKWIEKICHSNSKHRNIRGIISMFDKVDLRRILP